MTRVIFKSQVPYYFTELFSIKLESCIVTTDTVQFVAEGNTSLRETLDEWIFNLTVTESYLKSLLIERFEGQDWELAAEKSPVKASYTDDGWLYAHGKFYLGGVEQSFPTVITEWKPVEQDHGYLMQEVACLG